jgi:hypothetical protein
LLREVLTDQYATILATLGLTDWANELKLANERFTQLMLERYNEAAQRPTIQMKATRLAVDKVFRAILNQVEALVLVNGIDNYQAFIKDVNVVMKRYKDILAQEKGQHNPIKD